MLVSSLIPPIGFVIIIPYFIWYEYCLQYLIRLYLKDFGDISKIECIVKLWGFCLKSNCYLEIDIYGAINNCTCHTLDRLEESSIKESSKEWLEYFEENISRWLRYTQQIEMPCESRRKCASATSRRSRTYTQDSILNVLPESLFPII